MNNEKTSYRSLVLVSILILLSRLPFIFSGFGGEEDAWGTYIVSNGIMNSSTYEYSRLPGHPVQELVYALFSKFGSVAFNLITVLLSTIGFFFFMLSLNKLKFKHYLESGMVLAFIPIIYINSTNSMDYLWALAFILVSFYFLVSRNFILSGILLGLAIGCRITSGAILLPFILFILLDQKRVDTLLSIVKISATCLLIGAITYIPVMQNYGLAFFDYYKHFNQPTIIKVLYSATLGIFGGLGTLVFVLFTLIFLVRIIGIKSANPENSITKRCVLFTSAGVVLLYLIAYFILPFKSEFLIPVLPFAVMTMVMYLPKTLLRIFLIGLIVSCFLGGINLIHDYRGITVSKMAISKNIKSELVAFDLLKGPVIAEQEKRNRQMQFAQKIIEAEQNVTQPTVIISGWWYNYIKALNINSNHNVNYVYYEPQSVLVDFKSRGYQIFYLPEQDYWNNKRFKSNFTKELANLWILD